MPAAISPVLVGVALAFHDGKFAALPALAALIGAVLIQIGTNFANDYYDAVKGADTEEREGFTRVTQSGLIKASEVKRAMYATFALAILVGTYLVYVGGVPILVVGLLSVASGIAYTGGPWPFGYHGLGDLFVFVFFGLVAVMGTYYVQAAALLAGPFPVGIPPGTVTVASFVASLPIAAISTDILVVNNVRDLETDRKAGKHTLAVILGYRWSRIEFITLLVLAYLTPLWFVLQPEFSATVLLPWLTLPLAVRITRTMLSETGGEVLNDTLSRTGQLLFAYAALFAAGFAL